MQIIKALCVLALLSMVALFLFPASTYHFAYFSGFFASFAGLLAVENSYRTQKYVSTRGGIIEKSNNPVRYAVPYVILGIFFAGLIFTSMLGSVGMIN